MPFGITLKKQPHDIANQICITRVIKSCITWEQTTICFDWMNNCFMAGVINIDDCGELENELFKQQARIRTGNVDSSRCPLPVHFKGHSKLSLV